MYIYNNRCTSVFQIIPPVYIEYGRTTKRNIIGRNRTQLLCKSMSCINMQNSDIFSAVVFLWIINIIFTVAGIFLNSVVIISLWRSSQLRKKLCYFMVLLLSCFDLAVVTITHPFLIVSTIYFSQEKNHIYENTRNYISSILYGSSMFSLFMLNVERFLALRCPFFHQASVTKARLLYFQAFLTVITNFLICIY